MCVYTLASVAASVYNHVYTNGNYPLEYEWLQPKATLAFLTFGSPSLLSIALAFLYMQTFRGIVKPSLFKRATRILVCCSALILGAALFLGIDQYLADMDLYEEGYPYFESIRTAGPYMDRVRGTIYRYRFLSVLAVVQLATIMTCLLVTVRRARASLDRTMSLSTPSSYLEHASPPGSPQGAKRWTKKKRRLSKLDLLPWVYATYCTAYIAMTVLMVVRVYTSDSTDTFKTLYKYLLVPANVVEGVSLAIIVYPGVRQKPRGDAIHI
ncbi:hypothetical protein KIPB_004522 [Kipferlia bialata]|uniref:Uncharacterized protein n=1 Tax=Kipferlia bialata TaxID=797122 RepID=A0A9K3GIB5_9EUKA|nr:hypothetical protein KIPB_004522 [Kipferlia bialata]|eukprot:g4522.t1